MRAIPTFSALVVALHLSACTDPSPTTERPFKAALDPADLSDATAFEEVRNFVALGPRNPGSDGAERAALYLHDRLQALGFQARLESFEDPTPEGSKTFRNVLATSTGRYDRIVVLLSHYDTKADIAEDFAGANDSGSSTGLLLALAPLLREGVRGRLGVMLAFVDGEECLHRYGPEDGLHGSRRLATQFKNEGMASNIAAVIVVDMIGDRDLNISIPRNGSPALISLAFQCAQEEGVRSAFSLYPSAIIDDHVPFLEAGFHAVDLIDFHYGSAPGRNDYWHTAEDRMDKLSAKSLGTVGRVVLRMLNALAEKN
ncbi:MAG: M28 family peptidase [Verrucomicrobia bacterium]|nr:M28 family peptidase [Verrucomicrobiota bacterium]